MFSSFGSDFFLVAAAIRCCFNSTLTLSFKEPSQWELIQLLLSHCFSLWTSESAGSLCGKTRITLHIPEPPQTVLVWSGPGPGQHPQSFSTPGWCQLPDSEPGSAGRGKRQDWHGWKQQHKESDRSSSERHKDVRHSEKAAAVRI